MAKKSNDNGLYLPLRIDLDAWEASLAALDEPLQKQMRKLRSETRDLEMQYKVKITGAKAAGDQLKVLALENEKLNKLYQIQVATVNGLTAAYKKQVEQTGENSRQARALANELQKQTIRMNELKIQMNSAGEGLGAKISDKLASISPEFAKIRGAVSSVSSELGSITAASGTAAAAIGGVAAAVGALYAGYKGLEYVKNTVVELGENTANLNETTFELAERMGLAYDVADRLSGIFAIDGTNVEVYIKALQKFNKTLNEGGESSEKAARFLEHYKLQLQDASGTQLPIEQQTENIAKAFARIESEGEKLDFLVKLLGTSGTQFMHLFKGFDDYAAKEEQVRLARQIEADSAHEVLTVNNQLALGYKRLAAAKGEAFVDPALKVKQEELRNLQMQIALVDKNRDAYNRLGEAMGKLGVLSERLSGKFTVLKDRLTGWAAEKITNFLERMGVDLSDTTEKVTNLDAEIEKITGKKQDSANATETFSEAERRRKEAQEIAKEAEKAAEARLNANKRVQRELDDIGRTELEKEIARLEDKKAAYIKDGADEVAAEELFQRQKAEIEKKYAEKNNGKQQVQAAQNAQKEITAVFETETQRRIEQIEKQKQAWIDAGASMVEAERAAQKQINDARISEAEKALQQRLDLIRRMQKEEAAGGNWQERAAEWADKQYKRSMGIKDSDISALQRYGVDLVNALGNARDRVLAGFATGKTAGAVNNNNSVTINFDNTVIENESAMQTLANKVAEVILPVVENAVGSKTANSYSN